ncbi:hypothetical protein CC79DRAFT_1334869 [Sarocladium strictum]
MATEKSYLVRLVMYQALHQLQVLGGVIIEKLRAVPAVMVGTPTEGATARLTDCGWLTSGRGWWCAACHHLIKNIMLQFFD